MMSDVVYSVGKLLKQPDGSTDVYDIDIPFSLKEEGYAVQSNLTATVKLMKIEDGVNVHVDDLRITITLQCNSCLEDFEYEIHIPHTERLFNLKKNKVHELLDDTFQINMKELTIDISEMLRQEILIHIPSYPVCTKSCKGICPKCGVNRNKKTCSCKIEKEAGNKPFKNLKDLVAKANKNK